MLKQVYSIAITSRLVTIGLAIAVYFFTGSYDSSGEIQLKASAKCALNVFLRWDALYFLHIAEKGYVFEQETAFFPVMPLLAKLLANTVFLPLQGLLGNRYTLLLSGVTVANVSFVLAAGAFYKLTIAVLPKNKQLAYVSSIAFCLSPPAMFMSSFYTESIFALMTFTGMRWAIEKKYMQSALIWGIASAVRSNAIVYAGFFFYDLVWIRLIHRKNFVTGVLRSIVYTMVTASGFALFQYYAYKEFCSLDRPWCTGKIPLIYSFVQKEYWDVGFMSYYEIKQIPNFVLAAPIIALSVFGLKAYIQHNPMEFWTLGIKKSKHNESDGYCSSKLAVFMYLWAFLLLFATTNMHIQVIIRFFTSVPPFYWYVGSIWIKGFCEGKHTWMANVVLGYFAIYGLIGIVLFSSFLPPA
ncbi:dolichol-p-mannose mannosyltransferase [Mucor ambiguus]|uniref:GPI mannosyltransferase 2 n=1 Tax=Mucor ambiguus TaxID=91626 RepID=A0A0C9MG96_9FUNG|nr:dolichol-p-mannose mannosyltransferase [Mucor ambiguus]